MTVNILYIALLQMLFRSSHYNSGFTYESAGIVLGLELTQGQSFKLYEIRLEYSHVSLDNVSFKIMYSFSLIRKINLPFNVPNISIPNQC